MTWLKKFGVEKKTLKQRNIELDHCVQEQVSNTCEINRKELKPFIKRQSLWLNVLFYHIQFLEKSSGDCCFRYGFGARAIPCCLETITCEEHDKLVEDNKENPIAGGAFGKHTTCPKDAAEAHRLISG